MTDVSSGALRVLVVDDCRDIADSQAVLLGLWGHDVRVAYGGPAALEAAASYRPHVVLLDIGMPGMSGWEVARRLRQSGFEQTLLVAVTAYGDADDFRRSEAAGFDHHLVKPVDADWLQQLLARRTNVGKPGWE